MLFLSTKTKFLSSKIFLCKRQNILKTPFLIQTSEKLSLDVLARPAITNLIILFKTVPYVLGFKYQLAFLEMYIIQKNFLLFWLVGFSYGFIKSYFN